MAPVSIKPLTEMSTKNFPGNKAWTARKADNLIAICEPIFWEMLEPRFLKLCGLPLPDSATPLPFVLDVYQAVERPKNSIF
jgi:hypothetical protein